MMKHLVSALAGAVIGSIATLAVVFVGGVGLPKTDDVEWFKHEGVCLSVENLRVLKVVSNGRALVSEEKEDLLKSPLMLFVKDGEHHFYDEQIITMPKGKCAKHVGNFHFQTKDDGIRIIPVVKIK